MDIERPVFIIGSPRSGSTYLGLLLSSHPDIFITYETRVMIFTNRMLVNAMDENCAFLFTEEFRQIVEQQARELIITFYRKINTKNAKIWGDKYPNYANDKLDPYCLENIDRLFPKSKFIHIVRDPRAVIQSLMDKHWHADYGEATEEWCLLTQNAINWGECIKERYHQIRYEDLIANPHKFVGLLLRFLDVPDAPEVFEWIRENRNIPYSRPTSNLQDPINSWKDRIPWVEKQYIEQRAALLMGSLGYDSCNPPA